MMPHQPPNDVRSFVHKRIGRAVIGLATGGPSAAVAGFVRSDRPTLAGAGATSSSFTQLVQTKSWSEVARLTGMTVAQAKARWAALQGGSGGFSLTSGECPPLMKKDFRGKCVFAIGEQVGRDDVGVGNAVMGRYGAALEPGNMVVNRAVCLPGMHLADDGLCYNKGAISNKQRAWPRGRKPLLTGGEMRAISVASTAAKRLTRTAVRLQEMGLIKKPVTRKPPKKKAC